MLTVRYKSSDYIITAITYKTFYIVRSIPFPAGPKPFKIYGKAV